MRRGNVWLSESLIIEDKGDMDATLMHLCSHFRVPQLSCKILQDRIQAVL